LEDRRGGTGPVRGRPGRGLLGRREVPGRVSVLPDPVKRGRAVLALGGNLVVAKGRVSGRNLAEGGGVISISWGGGDANRSQRLFCTIAKVSRCVRSAKEKDRRARRRSIADGEIEKKTCYGAKKKTKRKVFSKKPSGRQ